MKIIGVELSPLLRKDISLVEFINNVAAIFNHGRYQLRIVASVPTWTGESGEHLLYISGSIVRLYIYDDTNSEWKYIEWGVGGQGQAAIVATIALTGQTGAIGATLLYTATAGTYRASVYQLCSKAGGGGTVDTYIVWTDNVQAQTVTPAAQLDVTGSGNAQTGITFVQSVASAINYSVAVGGFTGAPEYDLYIVLEKIT